MKRLLKWLLVPAVLAAGLTLLPATESEAARVRVHVGYPGYYAPYVYGYRVPGYYAPRAYWYRSYWAPPPVRVHVYRPPAHVGFYPGYHYAPAPYYQVWE